MADPSNQTTDPLNAFAGAERQLRDAIERVLFREVLAAQLAASGSASGYRSPGTLHAANEIMALVMEAGR